MTDDLPLQRCLFCANVLHNLVMMQARNVKVYHLFTHLRPYLTGGDANLLVVAQLDGVNDLVIVRSDAPHHLLVLRVSHKQPLDLA